MSIFALLFACVTGGSAEFGGKFAPADTGAPSHEETGSETGTTPEETGTDSGIDDSGITDTGTEPTDTGTEDTGVADTGAPVDTGSDDTGTPVDSGTDSGSSTTDADGDLVYDAADCAPNDSTIHPYADEVCGDGIDQNCDGVDDPCPVEDTGADDTGSEPADTGTADTGTEPVDTGSDDTGVADTGSTDTGTEDTGGTDTGTEPEPVVDADGDGIASDVDCDDTNADIHPYATEVCNSFDDDCDGVVNDGLTTYTIYADTDGDGYGDSSVTSSQCDPSSTDMGWTFDSTDCDDTDSSVNPGEAEVCDDGIDNDCDGSEETCESTVVPMDGVCDEDDILLDGTIVYIGVDCMSAPWNEYDAAIIADVSPSGGHDYDPTDSEDVAELTDDTSAWAFDFAGEPIGTYQFQFVSSFDSTGNNVGGDSSLWVWVQNNGICWEASAGSDAEALCSITGGPYDDNGDGTDDWADFMFRVTVDMDGTVEPAGDGA
jgi:hypothetical protein